MRLIISHSHRYDYSEMIQDENQQREITHEAKSRGNQEQDSRTLSQWSHTGCP